MIAPRFGESCACEACTVAGVRGKRTIETAPGQYAHGRELANLYRAIEAFAEMARKQGQAKAMPAAKPQTDPDGHPL